MIYEVLTIENNLETLRQKSKEVDISNYKEKKETKKLILDMFDTMLSIPGAAGLAAIQVGKPVTVFVWKYNGHLKEIVNPKIVKILSNNKTKMLEGCLSLPDKNVEVERFALIEIEGFDIDGDRVRAILERNEAIVFQHELDHLLGKLICDY